MLFSRHLRLLSIILRPSLLFALLFQCSIHSLRSFTSALSQFRYAFAGPFLRRSMLGLRSANESKHGATRSALASEQRPSLPSTLSPVYSYGAHATLPFYTLHSIISRDYTSMLSDIVILCYLILLFYVTSFGFYVGAGGLVFESHKPSVDIYCRSILTADVSILSTTSYTFFSVHLYPLRFRRSILTALNARLAKRERVEARSLAQCSRERATRTFL